MYYKMPVTFCIENFCLVFPLNIITKYLINKALSIYTLISVPSLDVKRMKPAVKHLVCRACLPIACNTCEAGCVSPGITPSRGPGQRHQTPATPPNGQHPYVTFNTIEGEFWMVGALSFLRPRSNCKFKI